MYNVYVATPRGISYAIGTEMFLNFDASWSGNGKGGWVRGTITLIPGFTKQTFLATLMTGITNALAAQGIVLTSSDSVQLLDAALTSL